MLAGNLLTTTTIIPIFIMKPIIIIDDDQDDLEILKTVFKELNINNEIISFHNGHEAFEFLCKKEVVPFLIFSDTNLPLMTGIQLHEMIQSHEDTRKKCIPFIFLTTGGYTRQIQDAYSKIGQGFFIKPTSLNNWKVLMNNIINYWSNSEILKRA
jgi:two-component SAPR family response regulator